ncbi:MAG: hypothetical protein IJN54_15050 [Lachnospiraceae bacterium]|nr:hypothetical protein [Lachnospiraceae bacterium]
MLELILEFLQLLLWFIIVPFAIGWIPCAFVQKKTRSFAMLMVAGYITMFAVFEVLVVPMVLAKAEFTTAVKWASLVLILTAAVGVGLAVKTTMEQKKIVPALMEAVGVRVPEEKPKIQTVLMWILFLVLVGFQLYQAFSLAVFDGDDAYYVAQSVTAVNRDSMYGYIPYNGFGTDLDIRHAMAVLPLWIAFVAKQSGIHANILSHTILPFVFVPITYLSYYLVAKRLFSEKKQMIPAFLTIIGVLQIFGNVSIYTKETFFVMRTWQGKSLFANFILTMAIAIMLWLFSEYKEETEKKNQGLWILLFCTNIAAAFATTMGVFLMAILIGITGTCLAVRNKSARILWKFVISCIPCIVFTVLYLGMK